MEEKTFKVTLADGSSYTGCKQNGSYYVTKKKITEASFDGKLSSVVIEDSEGNTESHTNMELIAVLPLDGGYGFALRDMTAAEIEKAELTEKLENANTAIAELSEMMAAMMG